jgi:membrane protein DedA with SNARE-associated domain
VSQISQFLVLYGGLILFITVFAGESGLPLPSEPLLLAAGALAAGGRLSLFAAICWAAAGSFAADVIWFYVGQHGKNRIFQVFPHLHIVRQRLAKATQARSILHGMRMLTAAKFLPFGTVIPLHAGALEVGSLRFLLVDGACSVAYASVYILLGFFFHNHLERLTAIVQRLGMAGLLLILLLVGIYVACEFIRRNRVRPNSPKEAEAKTLNLSFANGRWPHVRKHK